MAYSEGYSGEIYLKALQSQIEMGEKIPSRDWTGIPEVTTVLDCQKCDPKWTKTGLEFWNESNNLGN